MPDYTSTPDRYCPVTIVHYLSARCCLRGIRMLIGTALFAFLHAGAAVANEEPGVFRNLVQGVSMTAERLMMRAVCGPGGVVVRGGVSSCAVCPSYTSSAGEKTGFVLTESLSGSFAGERDHEVVLNMEGCESQADLGGGMVLLRREATGWTWMQYLKGNRWRDCLKYRTLEGTQSLLCNQSTFFQGAELGEILWISLSPDSARVESLLQWYDNVNSNPRKLVTVFPYRFHQSDYNQDSRRDVRILFRLREEIIPDKYAGAIDAIDAGYELASPRSVGLTYFFDGKSMTLHKESRQDFDEIQRLLRDNPPVDKPAAN